VLISFDNVSKAFGENIVLKDFSLLFPPRGIVSIMGPSGFGKTTLFRLLAGLEKPDSGTVTAQYSKLSMVFQEDRLLSGVSSLGNINAVLDKKDDDLAMMWLRRMGLSDCTDLLPNELSGGMRRRLSIARAMAFGGDFILLDEPFAGLDDETRERIYPYIFNKDEPNRLTIVITHDRQEAQFIADRLITMTGPPLTISDDTTF
jgi:NitT/TauT family transport system ATP-binding protein